MLFRANLPDQQRSQESETLRSAVDGLWYFSSLLALALRLAIQSSSATVTSSSWSRTVMRSVQPMAKPSCSSQRPRRRSMGTC